jgi:methylmalonyl-CoA mutase N-terminal domain/subunit
MPDPHIVVAGVEVMATEDMEVVTEGTGVAVMGAAMEATGVVATVVAMVAAVMEEEAGGAVSAC